jgi:hypothetical protein
MAFSLMTEESNAYNSGLFTGKTITLFYFSTLSYLFYKKYLYLRRYNIK